MTRPGASGLQRVPFNVLAPGVQSIRTELDSAIARVLDSGWFLMGPELEAFEGAFAAYHGPSSQAVGVGSGTDALTIGLRALGVQPADEVLVTGKRVVAPTNVRAAIAEVGYSRLVLSACTPLFSAAKRLLVFARLTATAPLADARSGARSPRASRPALAHRAARRPPGPPRRGRPS